MSVKLSGRSIDQRSDSPIDRYFERNLKIEDMDFGRISIDETTTSSDKSTKKSINAAHQTSINDTPPEAGDCNPC
ncbi:hypothetical protein DY000_02030856 [Brassica cretica]|uniref:Uncharacterized protein n=1 Tax=Brassica cretica TaxID=69181 RepID=A0ABQ7DM51_BRACR|nr:hypothetical protein DY000_02030856 [Brassica cretica]